MKKNFVLWFFVAILVIGAVIGIYLSYLCADLCAEKERRKTAANSERSQPPLTQTQTTTPGEKVQPLTAWQPTEPVRYSDADAIVRKGEGIEHPLIRQLVADPSAFGYVGDTKATALVKKWAGREAHLLAIKAGYVDRKFGAEIRVKHADRVAYVLEKDGQGNLQISLRTVKIGGNVNAANLSVQGPTIQNVNIATTIAQAAFLGNPGSEHLQRCEYVYIGEVAGG